MRMIDPLLAEFSQEMASTRKMLESLPQEQLGWKPHPKSMSLGRLACHIAESLKWTGTILNTDGLKLDAGYKPLELKTVKEIVEAFDQNVAAASQAMQGAADPLLMQTWTLQWKGQVVFSLPKIAVLRLMIFSHTIHHRGQLSVYLRLKDVPLPMVYGPTADTPMT
ncbi:MAG: DinB family protein [Planctomycetota bacterium]